VLMRLPWHNDQHHSPYFLLLNQFSLMPPFLTHATTTPRAAV
jgi:hypothetical protein